MPRFDPEALRQFAIEDVLAHYGVPAIKRRGPCPLCGTENKQAFSIKGLVWRCFVCNEGGDSIQLYARLGGIKPGRAMAEMASHLGLIESTPAEWDAKRKIRQAEAAARKAAELAESQRRTRLAREAYELEQEALRLREWAARLPRELALKVIGAAIAAESRVMEVDYLEEMS